MSKVPLWPTRRSILAVSAVAAASGCARTEPGTSETRRNAANPARDRAATSETELIARYDAMLALPLTSTAPALTAMLAEIRAEHVAHLTALREGDPPPPAATASPAPATTSPSSTTTPGVSDAKTAAATLAKAEQDAASQLTNDIMTSDGTTAQLLASIAASEAGHAALLLGGAA